MKGYLSVKDYAEKKGVTVQSVYGKINRGSVKFIKVGSVFLVKDSD